MNPRVFREYDIRGHAEKDFPDAKIAAESLIRRKLLTTYQFQQIFSETGAKNLVFGPYVLLEPLGEGGMGQVFKARHNLLDRIVALKLIREQRLSQDAEAVKRFQREAKAAAVLSHPSAGRSFGLARRAPGAVPVEEPPGTPTSSGSGSRIGEALTELPEAPSGFGVDRARHDFAGDAVRRERPRLVVER